MFRQVRTVVLMLLAALGMLSCTAIRDPGEAGGKKLITNSVGMKLALIPAGEFMMGNGHEADDEVALRLRYGLNMPASAVLDEYPQHRVRITRPFYMGTMHVTRGQFRQFVEATGFKTEAEAGENPGASGWDPKISGFRYDAKFSWRDMGLDQTDEHPVLCVSWNDAVAFCKWLSQKEGKTYRLPTEAEWEYACRAGTTTRYWCGEDPEGVVQAGNLADGTMLEKYPTWTNVVKAKDGYIFTAPEGSFKPNAFGLYDMHGNGWQWCSDWYDEYYYSRSPVDDPTGPDSGKDRVMRGGSWNSMPGSGHSAYRNKLPPTFRCVDGTSFRVVMVP
jgi:formylglycine-generating enzyme